MGEGKGPRQIVIGGAALLVLVAVVGLASRAHTPTGGGTTRALDTHILLEYALLLMLAASVIIVPATIYLFAIGRGEELTSLPGRRNWMLALLLTMGAFCLVAIVLLTSGFFTHHHGDRRTNPLGPLLGLAQKGSRAPQAVGFDWMPVIVVSVLAVGGAAAMVMFFARNRPARERLPRLAATLALALDRTIEDLRAEPDPRRAVIAAYAQMERALARAGLPREPSEAPREYLKRALPAVGAGAASVERLTVLFERAKFSPHTIDAAMKDEAIDALEALRDELRGAA